MSELVWQFKASKYSYGSIYLKWRVITKWKIKKKEEMNKEELQKQLEKRLKMKINYISSFQLLSHVWLFATPWITAHQASLSITNSWSSPKPMTMESVMPSSHLILCRPFLLLPPIPPSIRVFPMSQLFASGGQSIGVSASASVLPKNTQDWSPLEWTSWISLQSKGLSRVFSNTTVQKHQFFSAELSSQSNFHIHTWLLEKP